MAPDHPQTRQVTELFAKIERERGFRYLLGVEVGHDLSHDELAAHYDSVVYTVGAAADRSLGVPGEELAGSSSATDFVGWYNGHSDKAHLDFPLDHERVVVVGNGNVALDVARILTADPERLARTDIADHALEALRASAVREVVLLGRRGPGEAAFTVPELVGLAGLADVDVVIETQGAPLDESTSRGRLLAEIAARAPDPSRRRIVLGFLASPTRVLGSERVTGVEVVRNTLKLDDAGVPRPVATGEVSTLEAGLVLRAVGYHGGPVPDLPYDAATGTVPNDGGRVRPGVYVAGWVKRGPTGFIGTNKSCAQETVARLLDDLDAGAAPAPTRTGEVAPLLRTRQARLIDREGWRAIDAEERRRGAAAGRPRVKITDVAEMLEVAGRSRAGPRARAR